jgi:hypothetical protein
VDRAQRGQELVPDAVAGEGVRGVGGVLAPGQAALAAVGGGLVPGHAQQRPHEAPVAGGHAQQRSPPRRRGQAVEHGLGLVGGRVPGRHRDPPPRRGRVADVAGPSLQVAGVVGPARAADRQRDVELRAQRAAVRLVGVAVGAQPVVDVQGGGAAGQPHGEVDQAGRVAPAGEQHQHGRVGSEQPGRPHRREHLVSGPHSSAAWARNSSVT